MTRERALEPEEMSRSFGYRQIEAGEKQPMVDAVFHKVASRYDLMNDAMSGGLHRLWKDAMVSRVNPSKKPGWTSLDVAGGTGDIAMRIVERSKRAAKVCVLDINASMLEVGQQRAQKRGLSANLQFVEANAEALPLESGRFDAYTIAFGIRNVPRMDKALSEALRVLRHGGQFVCLEFSQVDLPLLDTIYEKWSQHVIPRLGQALAGDGEPYQYLVESIRRFPSQDRFAKIIADAGFARVGYRNLSGGIAALHWGVKP